MLREDMTHPKEGRRRTDRIATFFLFIAGTVFITSAIGHALVTGARSWGLVEGRADWADALMSLFYVLAASECYTTNITSWAGKILQATFSRLTGDIKVVIEENESEEESEAR